jgi:AraC family transcriptional regulator
MKDLEKISRLVGDVTSDQLRYVDCAVSDTIGVFMPVAGQCEYAIQPEHTHPAWSFIVSFDSRCRTKINGKVFESVPSTVFVMPPHIPHQELPSDVVARYIAVMIDAAFLKSQLEAYGLSTDSLSCAMTCPVRPRVVDTLKEFLTDYEEGEPGYARLLEAGGLTITHLFIRSLLNITRPEGKMIGRMSITRAIEFINGHFGETITVDDLARVANLSPSHFSRVFRGETGTSPMEYIQHTRLDCAKRMLRGRDKSLSQIALDCGFNSSSYLYQCFTRAFNISPSDYRKSSATAE